MPLHDALLFLRGYLRDHSNVGSVAPTSRPAARALASRYAALCAATTRPLCVLEAGAGTGPVSAELVRLLRPGDALTLVEREPHFAHRLRERFAQNGVEIFTQSVADLAGDARFDCIVSSIPFRALPIERVREILTRFGALLRPGGELSFLEYAGGPLLRRNGARILRRNAEYANAVAIDRLIDEFAARHEFGRDFVFFNIPPTRIRHWRWPGK